MTTPTCQICGTTLNLEDGSGIETVIRRGGPQDDPDFDYWNQELCFRFCGDEHMRSWMSTLTLPAYEPPPEGEKTDPFEVLGAAVLVGLALVVLTGAVYGFLLLLERIF